MPLKSKLKFEVPLSINGFEQLVAKVDNQDWTGESKQLIQLMFDQKTAQEQYEIFNDRAISAIGKEFLPIYRMADGEFSFCLYKKQLNLRRFIEKVFLGNPVFKTMWGEEYLASEFDRAYEILLESLRKLSKQGILAIHFLKNSYYKESLKTMRWFDENGIELSSGNYTSFYFVYALLSSKDRSLIYQGKNILVITGADETKKLKISNHLLKQEKAKTVQVYQISKNKSIFDKLDLSRIIRPVDVVLVAAGIGSANILCQLQELNTLCIDAGIIIETFINPQIRKDRIFLLPTNEMDRSRIFDNG